jgi:hypothetical protein
MNERRWYADWRVWVCLLLLPLCALVQSILGLPFRIFDALWSLVLG